MTTALYYIVCILGAVSLTNCAFALVDFIERPNKCHHKRAR